MTSTPLTLQYDGYMEVPTAKQNTMKPIIFFDGVCHLCNSFVRLILQIDRKFVFCFAPLQGETAQRLAIIKAGATPNTIILWVEGKTYERSEAILEIFCRLNIFFKYLTCSMRLVPLWIRDSLYDLISINRYRIFGKVEFCRIPNEGEKTRFLP